MIKEVEDINLINEFLSNFKTNIREKGIFSKYAFYYLGDKPIGFINYDIMYERAELNYIFINEKFRNNNYASLLVKYMENDCYKSKCINISLEVENNNLAALNLYKKFGFKKVAVRKMYYENSDGILMVKEL